MDNAHTFKNGDKVWVRYNWSPDCWVAAKFIRETAKRYLIECDRGEVFFSKHNVKPEDSFSKPNTDPWG